MTYGNLYYDLLKLSQHHSNTVNNRSQQKHHKPKRVIENEGIILIDIVVEQEIFAFCLIFAFSRIFGQSQNLHT